MTRLSVILITLNEADNIDACLASVAFADEIIVLDAGSSDDTVERCRRHGAQVHVTDWPGFGRQKNRALDLATGDWVLSIDADERVSPELRREIEQALSGPAVAYSLPRLSSYLGRPMRHSGWWPDRVLRLFPRKAARFNDVAVHESLQVQGEVRRLAAPLLHAPYRTIDDVLAKLDHYSAAGAEVLASRGRGAGVGTAVAHGVFAFVRTYLLKAGLLDGRHGLMLAIANAENAYYKYLRLAERNGRLRP
jgi:glycosyltransferase involved in cell wall biosynthesis